MPLMTDASLRASFCRVFLSLIVVLVAAPAAMAQIAHTVDVKDLAPVAVSSADSGPRIWEFSRPGTRVLVLGTVQAVSQPAEYVPDGIELAVRQSGVVLGSPGVVVGEGIGLLRGLTLWPAIRKTKYLPEGQQMADVLPADLYASWHRLKAIYIGKDQHVERMLPMYGAWRLYEAMLKKTGLSDESLVRPPIASLASRQRIPLVDARYHLLIKDPKRAIQEFSVPRGQDLACLRSTLAAIDAVHQASKPLLDAWAAGDVQAMASALAANHLPDYCWARLTNEAIARQQGIELEHAMRVAWSAALSKAASTSDIIFTTAPVSDLIHQTGRVRWLLDAGFRPTVSAPDEVPR